MIDAITFIYGRRDEFEHAKLYISTPVVFKISFQYYNWDCNEVGTIRLFSISVGALDIDFETYCNESRNVLGFNLKIGDSIYDTNEFEVRNDGIYIGGFKVFNFWFGSNVSFAVKTPSPSAEIYPVSITLKLEPPAFDLIGRLYTRGDIGVPSAILYITIEDARYYTVSLSDMIFTFDDGSFRYIFSVPSTLINVYIDYPGSREYLPARLELLGISGYNPTYIEANIIPLPMGYGQAH